MIESINARFNKLEKPIIDRVTSLTNFKGLVSRKFMSLYEVLEEIKTMFKKF